MNDSLHESKKLYFFSMLSLALYWGGFTVQQIKYGDFIIIESPEKALSIFLFLAVLFYFIKTIQLISSTYYLDFKNEIDKTLLHYLQKKVMKKVRRNGAESYCGSNLYRHKEEVNKDRSLISCSSICRLYGAPLDTDELYTVRLELDYPLYPPNKQHIVHICYEFSKKKIQCYKPIILLRWALFERTFLNVYLPTALGFLALLTFLLAQFFKA